MTLEPRPSDLLTAALRWWWVLVLAAILGGAGGFVFERLQPPLYEARAAINGNLLFDSIGVCVPTPAPPPEGAPTPTPFSLTQYDEDMALAVIQDSLVEVMPQAAALANMDQPTFLQNAIVERKHNLWEVRFRHADAQTAQQVTNAWLRLGLQRLEEKRASGRVRPYVTYSLQEEAALPTTPTYYRTNLLVLCGTLIGLLAGVVFLSARVKG
ncbi:MAG TPA: hypothetical protein PKW33_18700 [Anaerolineaceae bacterium]|nr:hypothetical protein [Anaerolineaceae bacterium]HPN53632.1 hypothetical protein [Anaerolineaceae bacterium]